MRVRDEAGSIMIEALVFMVVIVLTTSAYMTASTTVSKVQRGVQAESIALQVTHGLVEEAQSVAWELLAFNPNDPHYRDTSKVNGVTRNTVRTTTGPTGRLLPTQAVAVKGVEVESRIDIVWADTAPGSTPADDYRPKIVMVTSQWEHRGKTGTATSAVKRLATINESPPGV